MTPNGFHFQMSSYCEKWAYQWTFYIERQIHLFGSEKMQELSEGLIDQFFWAVSTSIGWY